MRLTNCVYVYTLLIAIGCNRDRKHGFLGKAQKFFCVLSVKKITLLELEMNFVIYILYSIHLLL